MTVATVIMGVIKPGFRLGWAVEKPTGYITVSRDVEFLAEATLTDANRDRFHYVDNLKVFASDRVATVPQRLLTGQFNQLPDSVNADHLKAEAAGPVDHGQRRHFCATPAMLDEGTTNGKPYMYVLTDSEFDEFAASTSLPVDHGQD